MSPLSLPHIGLLGAVLLILIAMLEVGIIDGGIVRRGAWATLSVAEHSGAESGLLGLTLDPSFADRDAEPS